MEREASSRDIICSQPLISDPYEARHVEVRPSGEAGGGEGLYAVRDIEAGVVVTFYNGVRIPGAEETEEWEDGGYRSVVEGSCAVMINMTHS